MIPTPQIISPRGTKVYYAPSVIIKELKKRNMMLTQKIHAQKEVISDLEEENVKSAKEIKTLKKNIHHMVDYLLTGPPKIRHVPLCLLQKIKTFDAGQKKE